MTKKLTLKPLKFDEVISDVLKVKPPDKDKSQQRQSQKNGPRRKSQSPPKKAG